MGENCNISVPPSDSGEAMNHGVTLKIHPRAKDFTKAYSGCQTLFAPIEGGWTIVGISEFINGDPIRLWLFHESDSARLACHYSSGKLVSGSKNKCTVPESLVK